MNVNAVVVAAILRILRIVGESEFLRAATTALVETLLVETLTNFEVMLPLDFALGRSGYPSTTAVVYTLVGRSERFFIFFSLATMKVSR